MDVRNSTEETMGNGKLKMENYIDKSEREI
jgi:hypothetical protein